MNQKLNMVKPKKNLRKKSALSTELTRHHLPPLYLFYNILRKEFIFPNSKCEGYLQFFFSLSYIQYIGPLGKDLNDIN